MEKMEYKRPQWWLDKVWNTDLLAVTDEQIAEWKRQDEECKAHNAAVYRQLCERKKTLIEEAKVIFEPSERRLIVAYLEKKSVAHNPITDLQLSVLSRVEAARKSEVEKKRKEEAEKSNKDLLNQAVAYLLAKGLVIGTDFDVEDAVERANEIAADEAIAAAKESGDVYCGCQECESWDGVSNRCECGHRRVYWSNGCGHSFLNPHVYGEVD